MHFEVDHARRVLRERGLRVTAPRASVLTLLANSAAPISHGELSEQLGEVSWDRVTIYRNLHKLVEAGLARVVSREGGVAFYESTLDQRQGLPEHGHPHFVCTDCGSVSCLPEQELPSIAVTPRWEKAVAAAALQLQGSCPDCLDG